MIVVFYTAEVYATGRSLIQRSPTKCGVPECDREASTMRRPWTTRGFLRNGGKITGFEYRRGNRCLSVMIVVCYTAEVYATSRSLIQRSPTKCGVPECDREASIMRRPWTTRGFCETGEKSLQI